LLQFCNKEGSKAKEPQNSADKLNIKCVKVSRWSSQMSTGFNLTPNNNTNLNYRQAQASKLRKVGAQPKAAVDQTTSGNNPFALDNLFSFKKPDIVYDKVMNSAQMLGMLRAKKVAGQFMELTAPEFEVGKKLNLEA
jgi:hypothetical protein